MLIALLFLIFLYLVWFLFFRNRQRVLPVIQLPQLFVFVVAILIAAYNLFMFDKGVVFGQYFPVMGIAGMNIAIIAAILITLEKRALKPLVVVAAGSSILASIGLVLRGNGFVQSVNFSWMWLVAVGLVLYHIHTHISLKGLWLVRQIFGSIADLPYQLSAVFTQPKKQAQDLKSNINVVASLKTVILTLVVVVFFAGILSAADDVFAQLIQNFWDQAFLRIIVSLVITVIAVMLASFKRNISTEKTYSLSFLNYQDVMIPGIALVILFGAFIAIQINYLFGGKADLATFDITYSEYVRKGFLELLVATFFGGIIAYIIALKAKLFHLPEKMIHFNILNSALILELYFLLASALKRDLLYVDTYGLTRVRIVGGIFLAWLAIGLGLLLLFSWLKKFKEAKLWTSLAVMSAVVILLLNGMNIDRMVANGTPEHHDYKDQFYISNLSPDVPDVWKSSILEIESDLDTLLTNQNPDDETKARLAGHKLALISIQEEREYLVSKYATEENKKRLCNEACFNFIQGDQLEQLRSPQYFNLAESNAYTYILENEAIFFEKNDQLLNNILEMQRETQISLYDQERRLLRELSYPFITIDLEYRPTDAPKKETPQPTSLPLPEPIIVVPPSPSPATRVIR